MLVAEQLALEIVVELEPVLVQIRKHDRSLHDQVRRAEDSIVLNAAEGAGSRGGNARSRFEAAYGSAKEVSAGLRLAVARGYVSAAAIAKGEQLLDRERGALWGLSR